MAVRCGHRATPIISFPGAGMRLTLAITLFWPPMPAITLRGRCWLEEHLARWAERNYTQSAVIESRCIAANIGADLNAAVLVARWAYGRAFAVGSMTWIKPRQVRQIGSDWKTT